MGFQDYNGAPEGYKITYLDFSKQDWKPVSDLNREFKYFFLQIL